MIAADSTRLRGRALATERNRRRAEDLGIAVDLVLKSVPAIDALVSALEGAGGCMRLVAGLQAELARRRGGGQR